MIVVVRTSISNHQTIDNPVNVVLSDVKSVQYQYGKDGDNDCISVNRMDGNQNVFYHPVAGDPKDEIYDTLFVRVLTDTGALINEMELEGFMKGNFDE